MSANVSARTSVNAICFGARGDLPLISQPLITGALHKLKGIYMALRIFRQLERYRSKLHALQYDFLGATMSPELKSIGSGFEWVR
jgi:hypothetical protein